MSARLLHGVLLGTLVVLVSSFLELQWLFADWPYHRDWGLAWTWLPAHLLVGALLGLGVALALPLLDRRGQRHRQQGLTLLAPLIGAIVCIVAFLDLRFRSLGGSGPQALASLATGGLSFLILARIARSRLGWVLSGFVTPWFCCIGLLVLTLVSAVQGFAQPLPASGIARGAIPERIQTPPHVLLVVLDTVSAKHLGSYGYHRTTSPALDALADEGVVFEKAFSTAPWTLPSHASLFTGLHPTTHRTGWTHPRLDDGKAHAGRVMRYDYLTLAEELSARGYETCGVSEKSWLTDRHGLTQGFQHYHDYSIATDQERLLLPRTLDRLARRLGFGPLLSDGAGDKGGTRVVQRALRWLEKDRNPDRPYFLFLNLNEAHAPYLPPDGFEDFGRYLPEGAELEDLPEGYFGHAPDRKNYNSGARGLLEAEVEIQRALYDASILYQDGLLDQLFEGLRAQGLMEDTLVIVTADHGEEFNEQGRFGHQLSLSDRLLHVPLIMRYPSMLPARARVLEPVSLVDVFPTVLGVLQASVETPFEPGPQLQALEGFDLLPRIRGEEDSPRDWVLAHADNPTGYLAGFPNFSTDPAEFPLAAYAMHSITMLRRGNEKYFRFGDGLEAWLDLSADPREDAAERLHVAEDAVLPAEATAFASGLDLVLERILIRRELLAGHMARFSSGQSGDTANDAERQRLESIGYMGERKPQGAILPPPIPNRLFR